VSKFVPPNEAKAKAPADPEAAWRSLTERLIFACQYGTAEWLRICEETGRPFNRDRATRRCLDLAEAIATGYAHIQGRKFVRDGRELDTGNVLRAHAANDDAAFRLRYGRLLPNRPTTLSRAERRTGISDAQRQIEADELAAEAWGNPKRIQRAVANADALEVIAEFGGTRDAERDIEWTRDAAGMLIAELVAVLWQAQQGRQSIRQPSGLRKERAEWDERPIEDKRAVVHLAFKQLGIPIPPPRRAQADGEGERASA
jgi:hypothetical protein